MFVGVFGGFGVLLLVRGVGEEAAVLFLLARPVRADVKLQRVLCVWIFGFFRCLLCCVLFSLLFVLLFSQVSFLR